MSKFVSYVKKHQEQKKGFLNRSFQRIKHPYRPCTASQAVGKEATVWRPAVEEQPCSQLGLRMTRKFAQGSLDKPKDSDK